MLVLGIESSCDETAAAVVDFGGRGILSNIVASQNEFHARFGGVVPEIASRQHLRQVEPLIGQALRGAGVAIGEIDCIAATYGPGLAGCLLVGLSAAKGLAWSSGKPLVGVNHLEGHLLSAFLEHPGVQFPYLGLVVSGGHTSLYLVESERSHELLASTRDDAAGEAYDKVAKLLGLGYPGGPALDRLAASSKSEAVAFPMASMKDHSLDFSFSGLKTAVWHYLEDARTRGTLPDPGAVARGFQEAVCRLLIRRVAKAAEERGVGRVVLGGGVAANSRLRAAMQELAEQRGWQVFIPSLALCVDNGAMIAYAGALRARRGERAPDDLGVVPNLKF